MHVRERFGEVQHSRKSVTVAGQQREGVPVRHALDSRPYLIPERSPKPVIRRKYQLLPIDDAPIYEDGHLDLHSAELIRHARLLYTPQGAEVSGERKIKL